MDDSRVCAPLLAESDAQNDTSRTNYESSVTDADKVINTNIDSTKSEEVRSDEDLLKDLLADDYCHVCEAVLLFESQRLSHYEGKKHAQRVRVYLQAKRAENTRKEAATAQQRILAADKDHFCWLCNMVFSSHIVATSHYEGKVHAKNMRKQGLHTFDRYIETLPADATASKSARGGSSDLLDRLVSTSSSSAEVDLKDPNKYCSLCAATFNNPHMALQHYNGRKHQRNLSRRELLKGVKDHIRQADVLMCQICGVQVNSVEMYQAHMQGNKHLSRQKKVMDLCKTQQKAYDTFADELSDYIQIQKARGIQPRALPPKDGLREENSKEEDVISRTADVDVNRVATNVSPNYNPPRRSLIGCCSPAGRCPPPHVDPFRPSHSLNHSSPLPLLKRKRRNPSSSSASSSSYSSSGSSNSSSDSGNGERRNEKRRRERAKRAQRDQSEKEKNRKWWNRDRLGDSDERRRRKMRKSQGSQRGENRGQQVEEADHDPKERAMDGPSGHRNRKEKKKIQGDTRTEEERLWDDSILGF